MSVLNSKRSGKITTLLFFSTVIFCIIFFDNNISESKNHLLDNRDINLRDSYKNYFPVGAAIHSMYLDNGNRDEFVARHFSSVTPENQMKPFIIQPSEGHFDFEEADKIVAFAEKNNMKVRGHCLIWFHRMPSWFYKDKGKTASKKLILKRMKQHITRVMERYKGRVYCWDVVNEAVTWRKGEFFKSEDTLYKILGEDYICKAFQYAHEADPNAKLYYNDLWFNNPIKRDGLYIWLKKMKSKGIPIDGIGMQCHLTINGTEEKYLQETIDMFSSIGLDFQITELDISIYKNSDPESVKHESEIYSDHIKAKQDEMFEMIFRVCRKNKNKVKGITLWAPADGRNFLTKWLKKPNYPYLFDENLNPKNSFYKITNFTE